MALIDFDLLRHHVTVRFTCKAAIASALSEINNCEETDAYRSAVIDLYPSNTAFDAILRHAIERGKLWESNSR